MYPNEYPVHVRGRYYWELVFSYNNSQNDGTIVEEQEINISKTVSAKTFFRNKFQRSSSYQTQTKSSLSLKFAGIVDIGGSGEVETSSHLELATELERSAELNKTIEETRKVRRTFEIKPRSKLELYRLCYEMEGSLIKTEIVATTPKDDVFVDLSFVMVEHILGLSELLGVLVTTVPKEYNKKAWRHIRDMIVANSDKSEEVAFKALVTQMGQTDPQDKKRLWSSVRVTCAELLRDWQGGDKNRLFHKLLVRLESTAPADEQKNKKEWERIRSTCAALLGSISEQPT